MYQSLQVVALLLTAIVLALSLAHALELPGKLRLDKETYVRVQKIYYPGFTIGGGAEPAAIIALLALFVLTPSTTSRFWWELAALICLLLAHALYWLVIHPVNNFWTKDVQLSGLGATFFASSRKVHGDWATLRDVWEYSHVARSILSLLAFVFLALAVTS